ncbi:hypothetical protein A5746_12965 [Mycolicibacterium conceptionense]|uniref:hypothetical protein n=1 Tax=Mycolicibacterium conceptionense TaxID=451644 RepID=UPI0007ED9521|nr:hypothetical protein [Mycolicibacterium conceptionense]OBJ98312.1 hypothetical protein A5639_29480 [Mycolicibacterium conceptionense]OMB86003.1 hypothetical protein A5741_18115 [Mycolicibacterium conceptionense]OMB99989.1 hypothetical protein A5746_12965 [Mycolicibacterium conceptionense]
MSFDADAYDAEVLKPLNKDKQQLDELIRAVRQFQVSGPKALAGLDLPKLLALPPDRKDLAAHFTSLEMRLNKRKTMSIAQLLKKLMEELKSAGIDLADASFWDQLASAKTEALQAKLKDFAAAVALEHQALKVITQQQLEDKAKSQGLTGSVSPQKLASEVENAGVAVRPDFQLPQAGIPRGISDLAKHTEYRSLVDVLLLGESSTPTSIRVIDALTYGGSSAITAAQIAAAKKAAESGKDSDALQAAQKALGIIRKDFVDPASLHQLVLATFVATAKEMLARGELLATALTKLSKDTGLDQVDAARLLAKLSGSASTRGLKDVTNLLAEGALADARRTFDAVADSDQFGEEEIQRVKALLTTAEARKTALIAEYDNAMKCRDYAAAAKSLSQAVSIDKRDSRLQNQLDSLPPAAPENLVVKASPDGGVSLSWSATSNSDTRFIVVRNTDARAPANAADGTQLARDLTTTTYTEANPPVAQRIYYSVFAERRGVTSLPVSADHIVLPSPADVSATAALSAITLMWRLAPAAVGVQVTQINADGTNVPVRVNGGGRITVSNLITGNRYRFKLEAIYVLNDGTRLISAPATVDATPRGAITSVADLRVSDSRLSDGREGHRASWSEPGGFPVELWSFPINEQLPNAGSEVVLAELDSLDGRRVSGVVDSTGGRIGLSFSRLRELRVLAPITVDGGRGLLGESVVVGSAPSMKDVRVDRYGDELVVSWEWPHGDYSAAVTWSQGKASYSGRCSRAEYKADGGFRISEAGAIDRVSVATIAYGNGAEWVSGPVEVQVALRLPLVRYELEIPSTRFGRRKPVRAVVHSGGYVGPLSLLVVARTSSIMPSKPEDGDVIDRLDITMDGITSTAVEFSIPRIPSPFWLRLFPHGDVVVKLEDPPTNQLKG